MQIVFITVAFAWAATLALVFWYLLVFDPKENPFSARDNWHKLLTTGVVVSPPPRADTEEPSHHASGGDGLKWTPNPVDEAVLAWRTRESSRLARWAREKYSKIMKWCTLVCVTF
jgi:hypothetical protein